MVEDVHWADEATLEFLLFLRSRQGRQPSIVVSYRPEDLPGDSPLLRLSSRSPVGATGLRLTVPPLAVDETVSLVSSMLFSRRVSAEFAAFLQQSTDGIPLAVEELVRLMHDRADLAQQRGEWVRRSVDDIAVPVTIRDGVLERSRRLSADARAVLAAAAVLTDPASEPTLRAVAGLPAGRAATALAEVLRCGLLAEDRHGAISFRHVLACRAVYEAISPPERRQLHRRAGHALERQLVPADRPADPAFPRGRRVGRVVRLRRAGRRSRAGRRRRGHRPHAAAGRAGELGPARQPRDPADQEDAVRVVHQAGPAPRSRPHAAGRPGRRGP